MPDVRNCKKCGKVYNYIGGPPICNACSEQDEKDFKKVKEYLYDNPGASMSQVSEALDVSVEKITRYLREGRLEITENSDNMFLECEGCGKAIRTGRFCNECTRELEKDLTITAKQMNEMTNKNTVKKIEMRFLNKNEKK
jgi:flagellar operon protein (TIGR03826 family)